MIEHKAVSLEKNIRLIYLTEDISKGDVLDFEAHKELAEIVEGEGDARNLVTLSRQANGDIFQRLYGSRKEIAGRQIYEQINCNKISKEDKTYYIPDELLRGAGL